MSQVDYGALRSQILGSGGNEEAVTVNTRALIDKVLARYSGEWTVLRELLQNAADANASKVTVRFETLPSTTVPLPSSARPSDLIKHSILNQRIHRLIVSNNGQPFAANDWARLKRIAEGNPDEDKIGAFGVGFYSVFADCEEPFVSSGDEAMAFYWKGNSLFTRTMRLPTEKASKDTTFVLEYRNKATAVPGLLSVCQFLASSMTFVALQEVELWLDGWRILDLRKKPSPTNDLPVPREIESKSREGLAKLSAVSRGIVQIDAKWLSVIAWKPPRTQEASNSDGPTGSQQNSSSSIRSFLSRFAAATSQASAAAARAAQEERASQDALAENLLEECAATNFLNMTTASILTSVKSSFAVELERATKKKPPAKTKLAILTASHDAETMMDPKHTAGKSLIFASLLPKSGGKIFIGFPTSQTTGLLAHVSANAVIPTVERESIDLNAQFVKTWNFEILRAVGILCRIAYSQEASELNDELLRTGYKSGSIPSISSQKLLPKAIHHARQYTFQTSTPSTQIGQIIEESFWTCKVDGSIEVMSTHGMLSSKHVRFSSDDLSGFLENVPLLHDGFVESAPEFCQKLKDFGLVTEVMVSDMAKELEAKAISETQFKSLMAYVSRKSQEQQLDRASVQLLLDSTVVALGGEQNDKQTSILPIAQVSCFINPSNISPKFPTPPFAIPHRLTESVKKADLVALGWDELQLLPWLRHLIENASNRRILSADQDLMSSADFSTQVLKVLSRHWETVNQQSRDHIIPLLTNRTVIPTKNGMKRPGDAYFQSVRLFDDLSTIVGLQNIKEKFLVALGVRKTVDLEIIFSRLLEDQSGAGAAKWSHVDLIKYLASVQDDIPRNESMRLKESPLCPAENVQISSPQTAKRYKVSELFEPKDSLRDLKLPLLQWPGLYRGDSSEGRLLTTLGLRSYPSPQELIEIIATAPTKNDLKLRETALNYCIANYVNNGYSKVSSAFKSPLHFLPLEEEDPRKLATSEGCFTNNFAAVLNYPILRRDLHPHAVLFGVSINPNIRECIERLIQNPPSSRQQAILVFTYFATRTTEIEPREFTRLGSAPIVPIFRKATSEKEPKLVRYAQPKLCFLGRNENFEEMFDFVEYGREADVFLYKCGSKQEPSDIEIAQLVAKEPARILELFQSSEKYLDLLRRLARNTTALKREKALWKELKNSSFLLVFRETEAVRASEKRIPLEEDFDGIEDAEEAEVQSEYLLARANQAVLVDDFINYRIFNPLRCPYDELLEDFYYQLGVPQLSSIVEESSRIGNLSANQKSAIKLRRLLLERCTLFLHEKQKSEIKHNEKWLDQNLSVHAVRSISIRRSLRGHLQERTEIRSACITNDTRQGWTLWIVETMYDLFEVSQALIKLLLNRPKPDSVITLEMLLGSDLLKLRARGYNVNRILKANARQAKLAEDQRRQQKEEEKKKEDEERMLRDSNLTNGKAVDDGKRMSLGIPPHVPGAFTDSPEGKKSLEQKEDSLPLHHSKSKHIWSGLTKRFGIDSHGSSSSNSGPSGPSGPAQPPEGPKVVEPPPPYSEKDAGRKSPRRTGNPPEQVRSIASTQRKLEAAVGASRTHDSSSLFSRPSVGDTKTYCDESPSFDLSLAGQAITGMKIFCSNNNFADAKEFLQTNHLAFDSFARLLAECCIVFGHQMKAGVVSIFYDEQGNTVAFNRKGSIFCNFRFFSQLHLEPGKESLSEDARKKAVVYWFVVLCHELAHNLVQVHSAEHSFWTETFISQYFSNAVARLGGQD